MPGRAGRQEPLTAQAPGRALPAHCVPDSSPPHWVGPPDTAQGTHPPGAEPGLQLRPLTLRPRTESQTPALRWGTFVLVETALQGRSFTFRPQHGWRWGTDGCLGDPTGGWGGKVRVPPEGSLCLWGASVSHLHPRNPCPFSPPMNMVRAGALSWTSSPPWWTRRGPCHGDRLRPGQRVPVNPSARGGPGCSPGFVLGWEQGGGVVSSA